MKKVLIIDDLEIDRKMAIKAVSGMECFDVILIAESGEEGLEIVKSQSPDVVILDTVLPGMNGFETCQQIRAIDFKVKIIVVTGDIDAVDAIKAREVGADDYCVKTIEHLPLIKALAQLVNME